MDHKQLSEATVSRHKREAGCDIGIAIAREYQTRGRDGKDGAVVREAEAGGLPLLTVTALGKILELNARRRFTYDQMIRTLTTWEHPDDMMEFIEEVWKSMPPKNMMRAVLDAAHHEMATNNVDYPDVGSVAAHPKIKNKISREEVSTVLKAVSVTTNYIVFHDDKGGVFEIGADTETILEAMQQAVDDLQDADEAAAAADRND